ncbi:unnamed protein product [Ranitomeya imitator]|uniref:RRM domain-containing protein n=1 Tax=Ranitomeya imitator TaxID=111125 RepID=A0ABN9LDC6_9NEOB|nr:unnamed protein product [Ranitomeya imitator]
MISKIKLMNENNEGAQQLEEHFTFSMLEMEGHSPVPITEEQTDITTEEQQHDYLQLDDLVEAASHLFPIHYMRCVVHTLQPAIRDSLEEGHAGTLISKVRKLAIAARTPKIDSMLKRLAGKRAIVDQTHSLTKEAVIEVAVRMSGLEDTGPASAAAAVPSSSSNEEFDFDKYLDDMEEAKRRCWEKDSTRKERRGHRGLGIELNFGKSVPTKCVWIDGLPSRVTEQQYLNLHFSRYGTVLKVVVCDRSRGMALILYSEIEFAETAVKETRGRKIGGNVVKVDFAVFEKEIAFYGIVESAKQDLRDFHGIISERRSDKTPRGSFHELTTTERTYYDSARTTGTYPEETRREHPARSREFFPELVSYPANYYQQRNYDESREDTDLRDPCERAQRLQSITPRDQPLLGEATVGQPLLDGGSRTITQTKSKNTHLRFRSTFLDEIPPEDGLGPDFPPPPPSPPVLPLSPKRVPLDPSPAPIPDSLSLELQKLDLTRPPPSQRLLKTTRPPSDNPEKREEAAPGKHKGKPEGSDICAFCHKTIPPNTATIEAMKKQYHASCFTCRKCHRLLAGQMYYQKDGQPICEHCYKETLEKCGKCQSLILQHIVRALGSSYLPACFTCVVCNRTIADESFAPIIAKNGQDSYKIECMGHNYHENCYRCEKCRVLLSLEPTDSGCFPLKGWLLCKSWKDEVS